MTFPAHTMYTSPTVVFLSAALATAQGPAPQQGARALDFLSLRAACPRHLELGAPPWHTMLESNGTCDLIGVGEADYVLEPELVLQVLQSLHAEACNSGELDLALDGATLVVRGSGEAAAALRSGVDALANAVARPLEVEVAVWPLDADTQVGTVMSPQQYREFAENRAPLWRQRATTTGSVPVSLDGGQRTRYLRDLDVEIAKKASMRSPVVAEYFTGGRATILPCALIGVDDFVVYAQATWATPVGDQAVLDLATKDAPDLDSPAVASACAGFCGRITNGGALCAAIVGDPGTGTNCAITVAVASRTPPQQQTIQGLRVFPVGALTANALLGGPQLPDGPFLNLDGGGEYDGPHGEGNFDPDQLAEIVRRALTDEDSADLAFDVRPGVFVLHGSAKACAQAEAQLQALQDRCLTTRTIVHEIRTADGDGHPRITHRLSLPTLPGRRAQAARRLESTAVAGIGVEVAEGARITDPIVRTWQSGAWLSARIVGDRDRPALELDALAITGAPRHRAVPDLGRLATGNAAVQRVHHDGAVRLGVAIDHGDGPAIAVDGRSSRSARETTVR